MAAVWLLVALGYLLLYAFAASVHVRQVHILPAAAASQRSLSLSVPSYFDYYELNPLSPPLQSQVQV
jgi:hypothetical protein